MTKAKKLAQKKGILKNRKEEDTKKTSPKKSYLLEDEDEDKILDTTSVDEDDLEGDLDDADIIIPKTFDPFEEEEEEDF